jgi:heterodisulfide reductase subunit A-like polyferredoxin
MLPVRGIVIVALGIVVAIVLARYKTMHSSAAAVRRVIIVGGGLSGLCAAIEAQKLGAHVTLLEQEKILGGNSRLASSGSGFFDIVALFCL